MKKNARTQQGGRSQRQLRAGEVVRHALVQILAREDLRDPDLIGASVTISEVRSSPDLKHMNVFVAPLGVGDARVMAAGLNRCAAFLRGRLARAIALKFTPELNFLPDLSYEEAQHIEELLQSPEVARDLTPPPLAAEVRAKRAEGVSPSDLGASPLSHAARDSSPVNGGAKKVGKVEHE
jgi:ribosome-binding factor A